MTLKELIELRKNKYEKCSKSDWWDGYETGWEDAYRDLEEILEQNGFDMSAILVGQKEDNKFYSPQDVAAMSRTEIRENYNAILDSMSKWEGEQK